jgi:DNA repair photolyase
LALRDTDILIPGRDVIATTLTFAKGEFAASLRWEPGGDLPSQRIYAMKEFKMQGFETWVSMEPTIVPESTLVLIAQTVGIFDTYKVGKLNYMNTGHIDWEKFARDAKRRFDFFQLDYVMKESLSRYLT